MATLRQLRFGALLISPVLLLITSLCCGPLQAVPRRLIILRHGEKANPYALCGIGQQRAIALRDTYLGRDATESVIPHGESPAAFLAMTLHTVELATPSAQSWGLPVTTYAVVPMKGRPEHVKREQEIESVQTAAADVLNNPAWHDRTVVITWEHSTIAREKLEREHPGEAVTFRQLLHLDTLANVPKNWAGNNYDYLWIVDYAPKISDQPTGFRLQRQLFPAPFQALPHNLWGAPLPADYPASCERKVSN